MKCPHCGQEHSDTMKFCPETGKKLEPQALFCNNPACNFRQPLPLGANFCPNCRKSLSEQTRQHPSRNDNDNNTCPIIIAYERADEEDGYDDTYKYVTIFRGTQENVLYDGVVRHDKIYYSLNEFKLRVGNKTFINLRYEVDKYIEVSTNGVKTDLTADKISHGNYYGNRECDGFEVINRKDSYKYKSLLTGKQYDGVYDDFLINSFEKGGITYFDVFDRYTEKRLHSHLTVKWGGVISLDNIEFKNWLQLDNDNLILLINKYNHFCLDENELIVDNCMYDPSWKTGYRIWSYCSENRILTTFPYDDYIPNYEGIKVIRMRDENGAILTEIDADGLFLKSNFKFNRCLAIKTKKSKKVVVFIDENGDIHEIPNTKVNGEPEDIDCFFVTESVLVVNDDDGAIMLNTQGEEIFECYRMSELDGELVEFYDLDSGRYGVIDSTGKIIIPAEYDTFDVLV